MFSKGKRKANHVNAEAVLSEDALNDSLRAAQVIFQRHSQQKPATSETRPKPINTKNIDTSNELPLPRRSNTVKLVKRDSNNDSDIISVPRRPNTTKPVRHLKIPTGQVQPPVSPNNNYNIGSPDGKVLSPTMRKTVSPRESAEFLRRRNPPPNNNTNIDAAYIAAALAHSYVKESSTVDKPKKEISVSGINDDDLIAKSIRQEVKRDATPPMIKPPQERIEPKQVHNFEMNKRRMEVPQPVKRERIRPIQILDDSQRAPEASSVMTEDSQTRRVVSPYRPLSPTVISSIKSKPTTPMANNTSDTMETQSNDVDYIPDDNDDFDDDRNSIGNNSFSGITTSQQTYNNDTESLNLDNQNFSIGTNILPRKKHSSNKNPLKKIFGKSSNENTSYNTISRNLDPLLINNNLTQAQTDTPTAAAIAAAARGPVYVVPNAKQKNSVYGNNNNNNGSSIDIGSTSSLNTAATQMRFKTTMRYENRKKSFNEDKPWKSHKDAKFMSEQERKRYEGMWVSNRYRYLNMLYWWPVNDIEQEIEQDSGSESQSNTEEDTKSVASTQHSKSRTSSQIDLTKADSYSVIKSKNPEETTVDMSNTTTKGINATSEIDQANSTVADYPIEHDDRHMLKEEEEDEDESGYISDVNNEQIPRMKKINSHDSTAIKHLPSRSPSPVDDTDLLPDVIRKNGQVPFIPPQLNESTPITPPDYSDILLTLPQDGLILNLVVKGIWERSNLPEDLLRQIYQLVDTRGDGTLDRRSFLVGMWLVDQCLYGRKLPVEVDRQIWNSVDGYVLNVMQPRTEPAIKIKRRGKRNIVGRELSNIKKGIRHVHL